MNIFEEYKKVEKVIVSCETPQQRKACKRYVELYRRRIKRYPLQKDRGLLEMSIRVVALRLGK